MKKLCEILAAGMGLGFLPKAPGTFGSLWGLAIYYAFAHVWPQSQLWWVASTLIVTVVSVVIADVAEKSWGTKDDQRIVIDEVAGIWATYAFVPIFSWWNLVLGFALFRLFDVTKPYPARWVQDRFPGGLGVVADDTVAGIYAGLVLLLINHFGIL